MTAQTLPEILEVAGGLDGWDGAAERLEEMPYDVAEIMENYHLVEVAGALVVAERVLRHSTRINLDYTNLESDGNPRPKASLKHAASVGNEAGNRIVNPRHADLRLRVMRGGVGHDNTENARGVDRSLLGYWMSVLGDYDAADMKNHYHVTNINNDPRSVDGVVEVEVKRLRYRAFRVGYLLQGPVPIIIGTADLIDNVLNDPMDMSRVDETKREAKETKRLWQIEALGCTIGFLVSQHGEYVQARYLRERQEELMGLDESGQIDWGAASMLYAHLSQAA